MYSRVLEQGQTIENEINLKNKEYAIFERWILTGIKTVVSNCTLSTKYFATLSASQLNTKNEGNFIFDIGTKLKDFDLDISYSGPYISISFAGPSMNEKVADTTIAATHSFVIFVLQGIIVQYTYKIFNLFGKYIRTEVKNSLVDSGNYAYNLRGNIDLNNRLMVENSDRNKTKIFSSVNAYINSFGDGKISSIFF